MSKSDVVILGGGLAGLCLARQLQLADATLSITVLESVRHPVPVAAYKVGESTVEIGAHYLARTLQLKDYLDAEHLKKFGLRCFFGNSKDIAEADELGASQSLPVSSYQLDRGLLENHLFKLLCARGVDIRSGSYVTAADFESAGGGTVTYRADEAQHRVSADWVVDATGRRGLFRRTHGLREDNGLHGNAAWFRVDQRVRIDDWSDNQAWRDRIHCGQRWLSTNHLMGDGYWVWLIPLSSGATSIGIVTDARKHPVNQFLSHDRALQWLAQHQPQCAQALHSIAPMDYRFLRNYSYGCKSVFSSPRASGKWALTGEAGLFLDPFYSPGMDFIANSNTYITDLVVREKRGESIRTRQLLYQQIYQSLYQSSLQLYRRQYGGFGNFELMSLKTVWDYAYYWGVLGTLFVNEAMTDVDLFSSRAASLAGVRHAHDGLQQRFYRHALNEPVVSASAAFTDHASMPLLQQLNAALDERLAPDAVATRLDANIDRLQHLATEIADKLGNTRGLQVSFAV